jgi:large subunit ribosomal protein L44e
LKIPKTRRTFCPFCKKQTEHTTSLAKKKERGTLKKGSIARLTARGRGKAGFGNKGKVSRGAASSWKRYGAKTSKKSDFRLKCAVCKKSQVRSSGFRTKKLAIE